MDEQKKASGVDQGMSDKRVEKIVSSTVKVKKKSDARKFADVFIEGDGHEIKSFLLTDIVIPGLKNLLYDAVTNGLSSALGLDLKRGERRGSTGRINYGARSRDDRDYDRGRRIDYRARSYDYDDIVIPSRVEADDVLDQLDALIRRYHVARVADFYELVGVTGSYTDNDYGWTDLRDARVVPVRGGYMIKLPRAFPLD